MTQLGHIVERAILLECSTPKLGNVYPGANFSDMSFDTFQRAANAIGMSVDKQRNQGTMTVGSLSLAMTKAMVDSVGCNTSLGTILLLSPLILSAEKQCAIHDTLQGLTPTDSVDVYQAIRIANPGGMGQSETMDIRSAAPPSLLEAMAAASSHDDIALQYTTGFRDVFRYASFLHASNRGIPLSEETIQSLQLQILAERHDSLIVRKSGPKLAEAVRLRTRSIWEKKAAGLSWRAEWSETDEWMRGLRDENDRQLANPGTTADVIAAAIFVRICSEDDSQFRLSLQEKPTHDSQERLSYD